MICCLFIFIFFRKLSKDILWLTPPTHLISWLHFPPLYSFPLLLFFPLLGPFSLLFLSCCDYFERKPSRTPSPPPFPPHTTKVVSWSFLLLLPLFHQKEDGREVVYLGFGGCSSSSVVSFLCFFETTSGIYVCFFLSFLPPFLPFLLSFPSLPFSFSDSSFLFLSLNRHILFLI